MVYLDLITNLALLVALSVVSGFIDKRWPRSTRLGVLMQGALFGGAAVIGMLHPLNMGPGLIFDGRSVMVSLCALFFGPWAASVAGLMTIACRIGVGGVGTIMGVLVILSSAGIGLFAHVRLLKATEPPSTRNLYLFGLVVHLVMVALMLTLPESIIISTIKRVGIPVILLYPLATILVGKILSDQVSAIQHAEVLRTSEEKYKSVFEAANAGKSITLLTGEINVNQAFCDMLGYTKEELKNKKWQDVTPADGIEATQKIVDSLLQGKEDSARFNKRYTHKNGSYIWTDVSVVVHRDADRNPLYFITTIIDITERKRTEEALRESEEKFRVLVDSTPAAVMLYQDDRWIYANKAAETICGYSVKELLTMHFWDFIHPDYKSVIQKHGRKRQQGEKTTNRHEFKIIAKDGTEKWVDLSGASTTVQGRLAGIISILDITERKRAEEALRASDAQLRAVLDATPFPIAIMDAQDNNIEYWSQSALALFGHTAPTTPEWYQLAYPDSEYRREVIDRWKPSLETARLSGRPVNTGEYRISCHDGSARVCELYATFLSNKLIVTFRDVTDLKHSDDLLKLKNLVFDASFAANSIADLEGVVTEVNNAFLQIWGYPSKDEVVGNPISYFFKDMGEAVAAVTAINVNGQWQGDFTARKRDGSTFKGYAVATVIRDRNGKVTGYQSSMVDITSQRKAESQREAALEEIRNLNKNLEQRIKERTAELKETIDLLEETNKAFVGRELRIIELKEQIAELEAKITAMY
ncbi:MAG: PAS/PAC sensor hybrid histidine kinase [Syntrophaceae bacterium]|nr:MAG: PAS/PAC sensor hybrid histidine kinase [Syntrophaceae bacterium]